MMKDIYQHFRKAEHPFVDQVLSWKEQVERSYQAKLTDFLDPREQHVLEMLIGRNNMDLQLKMAGGTEHAERKRAVIAPFYEQLDEDTFEIECLEGRYSPTFTSLAHSDVMGAFLSLGLQRKKLGDIYAGNGIIQIMAAGDVSSYVSMNLDMIKNVRIELKEIALTEAKDTPVSWTESNHTVSSLRLDAIVKEIYRISRKEAVAYIGKGLVKLNYKVTEEGKTILEEGDMLSLRGKGRSKLIEINGQSKKGKWKITTGILK